MFQQTWNRIRRELDFIRKTQDPQLEGLEGTAWFHGNDWLRQKAMMAYKNLRRNSRKNEPYCQQDLKDLMGAFNCALNARIPADIVISWLREIDPRVVGLELSPKALTWVLTFEGEKKQAQVAIYELRDTNYGDAGLYRLVKGDEALTFEKTYI